MKLHQKLWICEGCGALNNLKPGNYWMCRGCGRTPLSVPLECQFQVPEGVACVIHEAKLATMLCVACGKDAGKTEGELIIDSDRKPLVVSDIYCPRCKRRFSMGSDPGSAAYVNHEELS